MCHVEIKEEFPSDLVLKTFQCNQCLRFFAKKKYLERHIKNHLRELTRPFKCSHCDKGFTSNYSLKSHMLIHEDRPLSFVCDVCPKKFKREKNLVLHQKRHLKEYVVKCEVCNQGFVCKGDYVQHVKNRHELDKEKVVCFICGKDFIKGHFKRHIANVHGETGQFPCELCGKIFDRKISHERHVKIFHNLTPQVCDICGHEFRWKHSLRDHLRIHAGLKPHQCEYCNKAFTRSDFLKQHIRTHTGQRPFECSICGKGFTQATPLKVHLKSIHGQKIVSLGRGSKEKTDSNNGEISLELDEVDTDKSDLIHAQVKDVPLGLGGDSAESKPLIQTEINNIPLELDDVPVEKNDIQSKAAIELV